MMSSLRTVLSVVVSAAVMVARGETCGPNIRITPIGEGLRFLGTRAVVGVLVAVRNLSRRKRGSDEG